MDNTLQKKFALLLGILLLLGAITCSAQPVVTVGLVDSEPNKAVLVNYDVWYANNAAPEVAKIAGKTIFSSPRAVVMIRDAGKGTYAAPHFHSTTDEVVIVLGGSGEILINGVWTPVKAGDVHVNPRGNIHATRVGKSNDLKFVSVFTPLIPAGGDTNFLKDGQAPNIPQGLADASPAQAIVVNYDEWYAASAKPNEPKIVSKTIFTSPRAIVMIRDAGKGTYAAPHFHATTDEVVVVMGGSGEIMVNGEWMPVKAGDVHVNPRGIVHSTRVRGGEDLKFVSIFTPLIPPGGDTNFLE